MKDFDAVEYLGPKEVRRVDRNAQLGFAAAIDAVRDAGDAGADPARCAVVAGVGIGGLGTWRTRSEVLIERGAAAGHAVPGSDDDAQRHPGHRGHAAGLDGPQHLRRHRLRRRHATPSARAPG